MRHLLPLGIIAFSITSLVIFFFGDSGLAVFQTMSRYESSLAANVEDLKHRNRELRARLQLLKNDRESIVVMAREIGMYEPGNSVVKYVGRPSRTQVYAMGDLLRMRKPDATRNAAFKETAIGVTFAFLLFSFLGARHVRRKAEKTPPLGSVHGTGRR